MGAEKITPVVDGRIEADLDRALYHTVCPRCGGQLNFEFTSDAEDPRWNARCCGVWVNLGVEKVNVVCAKGE